MADEDKKVEGGEQGETDKLADLLDSALGGFAPYVTHLFVYILVRLMYFVENINVKIYKKLMVDIFHHYKGHNECSNRLHLSVGRTTDDELDSLMEAADARAAQTAAKDFQGMLQQMVAVQEVRMGDYEMMIQ